MLYTSLIHSDRRSLHASSYNLGVIAEEQVLPGLSSMIEVKEASTPLTNWRFTGNTRGAIYGFEQSMDNSYMKRLDNRTPLKGLYLASAWGNPGDGFTGALMSGQQTCLKMMEDWCG